MGRKRKSRAPMKIARSPKQAKQDSDGNQEDPAVLIIDEEDGSDPLAVADHEQQQQLLPSPPQPGASEKPWAEKCRQWIIEQHQVEKTAVEPFEPEVDEDAEEEPLMEEQHQEPLLQDQSQRTETTLRQKLKEYSEKQILNSVLYECEWLKCGFETIEDIVYLSHVEKHLYSYLAEHRDVQVHACQWDLCDFTTTVAGDLESHVHFHAYHNRIKTYGASLSNIITIPKCNSDSRRRNCIDNFRISFRCEWGECEEVYRKAQPFFNHVNSHVQDQFPVDKKSTKQELPCLWSGCKQQYKRCSIALEHVRKHSTERTIGCYNCGAIFVSRLKYIDHCKRQVEYHNREFPCSECDKLFATKQLMTDHKNIHNKRFPCTLCPMMWPSRKALSYHIRYRHVEEKPYQCHICSHRTVTKSDLDEHVLTHDDRRMFRCEEFGCDAAYKCQKSLKKHVDSVHYGTGAGIYACHRCPNQYKAGSNLSKHLVKAHQYERPPGYNRFTYRTDRDGVFRLASFVTGEDPITSENYENDQPEEQEPPQDPSVAATFPSCSGIKTECKTNDDGSEPGTWTSFCIEKLEPMARNAFAIELKPNAVLPKPVSQKLRPPMKVKTRLIEKRPWVDEVVKQEPSSSSLTKAATKNIDDFTVMKRYLKAEKAVVISFEETDSAGSVIRSEMVQTTELSRDSLVRSGL